MKRILPLTAYVLILGTIALFWIAVTSGGHP